MGRKLIAYYRVSTKKQGVRRRKGDAGPLPADPDEIARMDDEDEGEDTRGLGLKDQAKVIGEYARSVGGEVLRAYQEIESGKRADRPELAKALAHAKRSGATLVIAKLDRLARNVYFTAGLMESKVEFVACDNPYATPFTIHILAAVAELEAKQISDRTRRALAVLKAEGVKLGSHREGSRQLTAEDRARGRARSAEVRARRADEDYADLAGVLREMVAEGKGPGAIATALNAEGHTTRRGCEWTRLQVRRVLKRLGIERPGEPGPGRPPTDTPGHLI